MKYNHVILFLCTIIAMSSVKNNIRAGIEVNVGESIIQSSGEVAKSLTRALQKSAPLLLTNQELIKEDLTRIFNFIKCQKKNLSAKSLEACSDYKDIKKVLIAATRLLRIGSIALLGTPDEPGPVVDIFHIAKLFLTGKDRENIDDFILPTIVLFVQLAEYLDVLDDVIIPETEE